LSGFFVEVHTKGYTKQELFHVAGAVIDEIERELNKERDQQPPGEIDV
jgi:hypothetical protein